MVTTNWKIKKKTEENILSKILVYAKRNKLYSFEEEASHQNYENCTPLISTNICKNEKKFFTQLDFFSTILDTNRRVYLETHDGDMTSVNTALATLGWVHFTLFTIATMPPLVHNLLFRLFSRISLLFTYFSF